MARGLQNYPNTTAADSAYPNKSIKDNPGDNTGTPFNKLVYDDTHQTWAKWLRMCNTPASGNPENEYSGFQYTEAARKIFREVGGFRSWNLAVGIAVSGQNSPLIYIPSGSVGAGACGLKDSIDEEFDFAIVNFINDSATTAVIQSSGGDTVNGAATYNLLAGGKVKMVQVKSETNWFIISEA